MRLAAVAWSSLLLVLFTGPAFAAIEGVTFDQPTLSAPIYPRNLHAAADGKVWFTDERFTPHSVGFFDTAGKVTTFPIPCDGCADASHITYIESITVGSDGHAWFLYTRVRSDGAPVDGGLNNYVGRMTAGGSFTSFPVPTKYAFRRFAVGARGQSRIIPGPDGNLWFTELNGNKIGRMTTSGTLTEFTVPSSVEVPAFPENYRTSHPSGIVVGPDGNLWFTEVSTDKIARITTAGTITEFDVPKGTGPYWLAVGVDGNFWFTGQALFPIVGRVGRMTPTGSTTIFPLGTGNEYPQHITSASDGNLYFAVQNGRLGRIAIPTTGGEPVISFQDVPAGLFPIDIVMAQRPTTFLRAPVTTKAEDTVATSASKPDIGEAAFDKRRAVTPGRISPVTGKALLLLRMKVSDELRPSLEGMRNELLAEGMTLDAEGLHYPLKPAVSYTVRIDGMEAKTLLDGTFTLPFPPAASSVGEIRSSDGRIRETFVPSVLVAEGSEIRDPILIELELSDGPNGMNDYPSGLASLAEHAGAHGLGDAGHEHQGEEPSGHDAHDHSTMAGGPASLAEEKPPDQGFPCSSHATCKPAKCPSQRCCLDYDGRCKDSPLRRWDDCGLRLQQFILSTCAWWVNTGCCINEGAIVNILPGVLGPGCYDNHRGRECQDIDASTLGLQLTTRDVAQNKAADPRTLLGEDRALLQTETVNVPCGATAQVQLHNNTCDNYTNLSFNGFLDRSSCPAGGSVSSTGDLAHFAGTGFAGTSTEGTAAYRHIVDQPIVYTAPSEIRSCGGVGTDVLSAIAGGFVRKVAFVVDCSKGVAVDPTPISTPHISPSSGRYPRPHVDVVIGSPMADAEIHYTLDGTLPTILSPTIANGGTVRVTDHASVRARAFDRSTGKASLIASADYELRPYVVAGIGPEITPGQKFPCEPLAVTIQPKPGREQGEPPTRIAYTLDGSEPLEATAELAEKIQFTIAPASKVTIKARVWREGSFTSPTTTVVYAFNCVEPSIELLLGATTPEFQDRLLRAKIPRQ